MKVTKKQVREWQKEMLPLLHKHNETRSNGVGMWPVNHRRRVRRILKTSENEQVIRQRLAAHLSKFGAPTVTADIAEIRKHDDMLVRLQSPSK